MTNEERVAKPLDSPDKYQRHLILKCVEKIYFFNSILIVLFERNNVFTSVARKNFFCDVLGKFC